VEGTVIWARGESDAITYTLDELKSAILAAIKERGSP
jgi:hypothetical protein